MNPGNIPRLEDIAINGTVLSFTLVVSLLTGGLFGVAPVWRAIKADLNTSLKAGGRSEELLIILELAFPCSNSEYGN